MADTLDFEDEMPISDEEMTGEPEKMPDEAGKMPAEQEKEHIEAGADLTERQIVSLKERAQKILKKARE